MNRRAERLEQARRRRRTRRNLGLAGGGLALVIVIAVIVLAAGGAPGPALAPADLPRIEPQETYRLLQNDEAALYDVRSAEAYQELHAEGALSLPEADALQALADLPADRLLIFY